MRVATAPWERQTRRWLREPWKLTLGLDVSLHHGSELYARSDIVDVPLDVFRKMVTVVLNQLLLHTTLQVKPDTCGNCIKSILPVATNPDLVAARVLMLVELSLQQVLGLFGSGIKCKPALVLVVADPRIMDARRSKPFLDNSNRVFGGCEKLMDLVRRIILTIQRRLRARATWHTSALSPTLHYICFVLQPKTANT